MTSAGDGMDLIRGLPLTERSSVNPEKAGRAPPERLESCTGGREFDSDMPT